MLRDELLLYCYCILFHLNVFWDCGQTKNLELFVKYIKKYFFWRLNDWESHDFYADLIVSVI